ncbi:hypothetical protein C464_10243 [Halorubrum coriense DSM 10284]|uniref:Intracellular proteinase inhibitor BsuPI domain-containing protein n=1 Tax=Halorubrum coriense DSM 10284 TaxID=1227466 RepID=M0EI43_9EURY|nr:BsuPI-related putative proteinase inhibitor [Halorubrum coriense]ELZ46748.1 hypothetical protein C464_10243 [Halorubrum coriense DSM 10284]
MLDATLATTRTDDGVTLSLRIENEGPDPVTLDFRTGQRAEFTAYPAESEPAASDGPRGDPVWRYGAGQLFTQALGSETIAPGEAVDYGGTWRDPPSGTYRVVGEVTATERDASAAAVVDVQ